MSVTIDPLDEREYARSYAAAIGQGPLTGLLHQRRRGGLTPAMLEKRFSRPGALLKFVAGLDSTAG